MLFDTHCHVNDSAYDADREAVFKRAAAAGVGLMICPATDMETSAQCIALAGEHDGLYAAVGIHPEEAAKAKDGDLDQLRQWLKEEKKVVAVGEVGLDYHWPEPSREIQKKVFIDQVKLAVDLDVPIIIHDREAHGDTLDILRQYGKGIRGVFHCYSGSLEMTDELLRMGFYFGFDGPLTYPNSKRAKRVASHLPLGRMLIETDCPYLTPQAHRGQRNEPAYVRYVAEEIANLRGLDVEEVARITTENARRLFDI
ncbi:TatD family hydrolase [uncultured Megasphaera sp.]|uniref:TatD family hydrolase n=1 Tax=uncultured Megasphaera sp. TaxID=165188 RepID=UPI0028047BB7|nr:TatD family hydrolase [uncultured Megasphaera sp.]